MFARYSALGNCYAVAPLNVAMNGNEIIRCCKCMETDGLLLGRNFHGKFDLQIFNPDGSEAEMSGNGTRIFAAHLVKIGLQRPEAPIFLNTISGIVICKVFPSSQKECYDVIGNLGKCIDEPKEWKLTIKGKTYAGHVVSIGNPHFVIGVAELDFPIGGIDNFFENRRNFSTEINVEFVVVNDFQNITIRILERGVGETRSCGSGAVASAIVGHHLRCISFPLCVHMPGGTLHVFKDNGRHFHIRGPIIEMP
ncbi:MAG: diaminopimelate epimerase [Puniceicoccales bacterium]|nr:diaminopimelate epimerase [Puniceicoccales bacterium]